MQKELLSAYMDGEQVSQELTEKLCQDKDLQQSWTSFHAIRTVMRKESDIFLGSDFTAKMAALIEQEEVISAAPAVSQPTPSEVENAPIVQKLRALFMPMLQVGIAAAVCLVAVFGVQSFNNQQTQQGVDNPVLQTLPFNQSVQEVSYTAPAQNVVTPEQVEQKNKRLGSMLQNYEVQRRVYADSINNK